MKYRSVILDGEVIVQDERGVSDFEVIDTTSRTGKLVMGMPAKRMPDTDDYASQ